MMMIYYVINCYMYHTYAHDTFLIYTITAAVVAAAAAAAAPECLFV